MAKAKGRVGTRAPRGGDGNFVMVDFDLEQRSEYLQWESQTSPDFSSIVAKITDQGWKLSVSYSEYYDCYFGSVTGKFTGTKYDGYTLSVRHTDLDRVAGLLHFIVGTLCPDGRVKLDTPGDKISW